MPLWVVQSHWLYGLDKGCKKPFKTVKNIGGIACMFIKAHPCGFVVWHFFKSIKNKLVLLAVYSSLVIVQKRTLSTLLLRKPFAWTWKLIFISKLYARLTRLVIHVFLLLSSSVALIFILTSSVQSWIE